MIEDPDQDALAAEYVLGTLDAGERARAEALRVSQPGFDAEILDWERRLAPLLEVGDSMDVPTFMLGRILAAIDGEQRSGSSIDGTVVHLRRQVQAWRSAAAIATALAAMLALWVALGETKPMSPANARGYVAVLNGGGPTPSFVVSVDLPNRRMVVVPAGAPPESGRSYELWMIGGDSPAPHSLGLLDASGAAHPNLPKIAPALISQATYAVTLEPKGGSPTGKPTSAPVYTGRLIDIPE